jgi:hypothetical protein
MPRLAPVTSAVAPSIFISDLLGRSLDDGHHLDDDRHPNKMMHII